MAERTNYALKTGRIALQNALEKVFGKQFGGGGGTKRKREDETEDAWHYGGGML